MFTGVGSTTRIVRPSVDMGWAWTCLEGFASCGVNEDSFIEEVQWTRIFSRVLVSVTCYEFPPFDLFLAFSWQATQARVSVFPITVYVADCSGSYECNFIGPNHSLYGLHITIGCNCSYG